MPRTGLRTLLCEHRYCNLAISSTIFSNSSFLFPGFTYSFTATSPKEDVEQWLEQIKICVRNPIKIVSCARAESMLGSSQLRDREGIGVLQTRGWSYRFTLDSSWTAGPCGEPLAVQRPNPLRLTKQPSECQQQGKHTPASPLAVHDHRQHHYRKEKTDAIRMNVAAL